jgi:hypothetical protein
MEDEKSKEAKSDTEDLDIGEDENLEEARSDTDVDSTQSVIEPGAQMMSNPTPFPSTSFYETTDIPRPDLPPMTLPESIFQQKVTSHINPDPQPIAWPCSTPPIFYDGPAYTAASARSNLEPESVEAHTTAYKSISYDGPVYTTVSARPNLEPESVEAHTTASTRPTSYLGTVDITTPTSSYSTIAQPISSNFPERRYMQDTLNNYTQNPGALFTDLDQLDDTLGNIDPTKCHNAITFPPLLVYYPKLSLQSLLPCLRVLVESSSQYKKEISGTQNADSISRTMSVTLPAEEQIDRDRYIIIYCGQDAAFDIIHRMRLELRLID